MPRALMGLQFFPRGGSSHVARNLATALARSTDWRVTIVSGSVRGHGEAAAFYRGLDVRPVEMAPALEAPDPLRADPPMHGSYEDRPDAPDRVFAAVDDETFEHHVRVWARELAAAGAADADVLHLHHLTPLNEAAARVAPDVPVVAHLHGTELLMLEEIEAGATWPHGAAWAERMRRWAQAAERLILISESQVARVEQLLDVARERCVQVPNGFDPDAFAPRAVDRRAFWRRHLVEDPQGWAPDGSTVGYADADLAVLQDAPVALYVGRYTAVKRIGVLIEAHARAQRESGRDSGLVLLGGFPGEWEGEHPLDVVARTGARGVFLAGWHGHKELPSFFAASDVVVLPSVREQFGQVLVEGMACGLPAIAVDAFGPAEIVEHGRTGWLVAPDDPAALAAALAQAVGDDAERRRRGASAREVAGERYAWPALAGRVAHVYDVITA